MNEEETTEHAVRAEMVRAVQGVPWNEGYVRQGEIEAYYWNKIRVGVSSNADIGIMGGPEAYRVVVSLHGHGVTDHYHPSDMSTLERVHESLPAIFLSVAR